MYALCNLAVELGAVAGFCVPRPQLLRRWLQVRGAKQGRLSRQDRCSSLGGTKLHPSLLYLAQGLRRPVRQLLAGDGDCWQPCVLLVQNASLTTIALCPVAALPLQAGVRMKQVSSPAKLIYPSSAHDYSYYKSSTVAYFMIDEIKASLCRVLCPPSLAGQGA